MGHRLTNATGQPSWHTPLAGVIPTRTAPCPAEQARAHVRETGQKYTTALRNTAAGDLRTLRDGDDVRDALARARGRGIERLRHFLELAGHNAEARVLDWVGRGGPDLVPVHRAQWWE